MRTTRAGIELIKHFEGFRAKPYPCPGGKWTIGYGSTRDLKGYAITGNHPPMDETEAEACLIKEVTEIERHLCNMITIALTDNQFSALVSLGYNIGTKALRKSHTLARLNEGHFEAMKREWREWRKAGGKVLPGLVKRREAELVLFETEA